jgi:quercetin dioxygenase-like cupin family protein
MTRLSILILAFCLCYAIAARAQQEVSGMIVKPFETLTFESETGDKNGPGITFLNGDPKSGPVTALIRFSGTVPMHTHSFAYEGVVIEGTVKHWALGQDEAAAPLLRPGSYWFQDREPVHADGCVSAQCLVVVRTFGTIDMKPHKDAPR